MEIILALMPTVVLFSFLALAMSFDEEPDADAFSDIREETVFCDLPSREERTRHIG